MYDPRRKEPWWRELGASVLLLSRGGRLIFGSEDWAQAGDDEGSVVQEKHVLSPVSKGA